MKPYFGLWFSLALLLVAGVSCGDEAFLGEAVGQSYSGPGLPPGDIIIVSGGNTSHLNSPYPLHQILHFNSKGEFQKVLYRSADPTRTFQYGADLDPTGRYLYFGLENIDRMEVLDLYTDVVTTFILHPHLTGNYMRATALLSDGGVVIAESYSSIEKFDKDAGRVETNFPLNIPSAITNIKTISGDRFVVITTGNPDEPMVYSNDGTLLTTISGLGCGTNCNPNDIVELADGRFVISNTADDTLELFDANFNYVGVFFDDVTRLVNPGSLAAYDETSIIACTNTHNTCEKLTIAGDKGLVSTEKAFIDNSSLMRQPTRVLVVP